MLLFIKSFRSQITPVIISGFILVLLVIVLSGIIVSKQGQVMIDRASDIHKLEKKINKVTQLIELAHSRSKLIQKFINTENLQDRNDIKLLILRKTDDLASLRMDLIQSGLSKQASTIYESQLESITKADNLQKQALEATDSITQAELNESDKALGSSVYPALANTVDLYIQLLKVLKYELEALTQKSSITLHSHIDRHLVMIFILLLTVLITVLLTFRSVLKAENQLVQDKEKAQVTLGSIGDGVISVNTNGEISYFNKLSKDIFSGSKESLSGQDIFKFLEKHLIDENDQIQKFINRMLNSSSYLTGAGDFRTSLIKQPEVILNTRISPMVNVQQMFSGVVISFHDISKSEKLIKKIKHMALHDSLTGVLNRGAFEEQVEKELIQADLEKGYVFCVINLDQFKVINDSAGHAAGDEMLQKVAAVMKPVFRQGDIFARLEGDIFAALLIGASEQQAIEISKELSQKVYGFGFNWKGNTYRVSTSIGMVPVNSLLADYNSLFQAADIASVTARNKGINEYHILTLDTDIVAKKEEESSRLKYLTWSLENDSNLVLFEQAIVPISERTAGHKHVEVLLRMRGVNDHIYSPMAFIPIAERYGMMAKIDRWVLQQVCDHILASPHDKTVYAVNLSGESLSSKEAMKELVTIIFNSKVPGERLCIEVTETVAISNLDVARRFMLVLQEYGCTTALDDFGSGLSSFSYLSSLPLDYLKIDGIFIQAMKKDKVSKVMLEAIVYIGRQMGLTTIAEYVDDEESVELLKSMKVDLAQGYYYDKPHELITPSLEESPAQTSNA